jgi:DNA-binding Lrp family transcriptional regulator
MDALDRKIIILLQRDPRITYRAISKQLGISVPTAQRRVESLFSSGRIRSIRYRLAVDVLGGKWVFFHGQARIKLTPKVIRGLQDLGSINQVLQCTYNYIVCIVDIRERGDIEGVMNFLMTRLDLVDPKFLVIPCRRSNSGLFSYRNESIHSPPPGDLDLLTRVDMKIILQLGIDGRKTIGSIAKEIGISYRTVKRRVDFLVKNGLIENEVDYYLGVSGDIWITTYVRFKDPSLKDEFFKQMAKYDGNLFTSGWDYSNAPDLVTFDGMFQSLSEINELVSTITNFEGVLETNHTIIHMSYIFDTWVHRMSRGELPLPRSGTAKGEYPTKKC